MGRVCCNALKHKQGTPVNQFDCNCYLGRYSDLKKAFGKDCVKAREHWDKHGKPEGRDPSCEKGTSFLEVMQTRQFNDDNDQQQPMDSMLQRKQSAMKVNQVDEKGMEDRMFNRLQSWLTSFVKTDTSLKGPKGDRGEDGENGKDGEKGEQGANGKDREKGEKGE